MDSTTPSDQVAGELVHVIRCCLAVYINVFEAIAAGSRNGVKNKRAWYIVLLEFRETSPKNAFVWPVSSADLLSYCHSRPFLRYRGGSTMEGAPVGLALDMEVAEKEG
jgi:hypothetical protein